MTVQDQDKNELIFEKRIKKQVLKKLSNRSTSGIHPIRLNNLKEEYDQIYKLLNNAIQYQEGKSCLLVGPRGSGKTTLINNALIELNKKYQDNYLVIKLNGLYQNDDKSAIKEIARQLDWQTTSHSLTDGGEGNDGMFERLSASATMNTIMSILDKSKLEEGEEDHEEKEEEEKIRKRQKTSKQQQLPIVFIIDEFDKYTNNSKQTLLYNLFDLSQSSSSETNLISSIVVIGLTTKTNVREQLEKRVKSRFSQRLIQINKCKNLDEYCEHAKCLLLVDNENNSDDKITINEHEKGIAEAYNKYLGKLIDESSEIRKMIIENFHTVRDLNTLKNSVIPFIKNLKLGDVIQGSAINQDLLIRRKYNNMNFSLLKATSELELKLLICSARQVLKNSLETINFNITFNEFEQLSKSQTNSLNSQLQTIGNVKIVSNLNNSKDLMLICWEKLIQIGLLVEPLRQINGINMNYYTGGEINKMYYIDLTLDEIMRYFQGIGEEEYGWVERWCRI